MLRLNASVHSWLTRHEKRKQIGANEAQPTSPMSNKTIINSDGDSSKAEDENGNLSVDGAESTLELTAVSIKEVSTKAFDTSTDTNEYVIDDDLHKQLKNEVGNMYKVWDEADQRYVLLSNFLRCKLLHIDYL